MGFIEGESLAHRLTAGLPAPRQAAELIKKVAEAVAYAHTEGVVHRDLKPANILIDGAGQPRLTDFGLAKHVERDPQAQAEVTSELHSLTQTGQILGTPSYMPPEQASGQRGAVGPLADIYALGAVLYCVLTGRPPFQAANPLDTLLQVLSCEPASPRQLNAAVPRDLETICLKCLNKEPRKRYATAQDLVADLDRYINDQPIVARPAGAGERLWKWVRRRPAAAALLLVSGIASIGLVLLLAALLHNAEQRAQMVQDLTAADRQLQMARAETDVQQVHLQFAKQEQLAAEKNAAREQQLASEAQTKLKKAEENFKTIFRSQTELMIKSAAYQKQLAKQIELQKQEAKELKVNAERHANGLRLIGQSSALRVSNPGLALLLAIEGQKLAPGLMANNALREAIDESHEERTIPAGYAFRAAWYTPDGKRIISIPSGGFPSTVRITDAASGKHIGDLELPPQSIHAAILSPDGKRIVFIFDQNQRTMWYGKPPEIIYTDCVSRVWDVATRKEIAILRGHTSRVTTAQFSPDGKKLVTASWDGNARIWDALTWKEERLIAAHEAGAVGAFFSPDGKSIVTASTSFRRERNVDTEFPKLKDVLIDPPAGTLPPGVKPGDRPGSSGSSGSGSGHAVNEKTAVVIWDATTGKQLAALKHGPKGMHQALEGPSGFPLAWSPKGDQIVTWSPGVSNAITLWDATDGKARLELPTGFIAHVMFNPDASRVLSVPSDRGKISLWDPANGKEALVIRVPAGVTGPPSYSPDARWIVAACGDKSARIWSADTGEELWCFRGHQLGFWSTAFSPDGKRVVTVSQDGTARIWSTERGRDFARVFRASHPMHHVAFSPNGKRLATSAFDRFLVNQEHPTLWDAETGKPLHTLRGLAKLGNLPVRNRILGPTLSLEFSGDGRHLLVATKENPAKVRKRPFLGFGKEIEEEIPCTPVRLWDVETGKETRAFQGPRGEIGRAAFSPNGKLVLAAERGPEGVKIYHDNGGQIGGSSGTVRHGRAYIWDAGTGKLVQTLQEHEYGINCSAWSPDSKRVLTADYSIGFKADDGAARIWDIQTGKLIVKLEGNRGELRLATFSPDGKHVIMLHHPAITYVEIWNASTGQVSRTLGRPTWYKYGQYPDPKSNRLVYKRNDRVVYVHEGQDPGHTAFISHAAYSRDGRRIITTSWDRTARVWDAATGKQLLVLRGHIMSVQHAAFSADGQRIVTASDDETARVWDAETGTEIFTLAGHKAAVLSAAFSPDGKQVATGSADGTARIWPLDPVTRALSRQPRELSAEERARFGIGNSGE